MSNFAFLKTEWAELHEPAQRAEYSASLVKVRAAFAKLGREIPDQRRLPLILRCIDNVQKDLTA